MYTTQNIVETNIDLSSIKTGTRMLKTKCQLADRAESTSYGL